MGAEEHAILCGDVEATAACAAAFARQLEPGQIIFLEGPLGAGKTTFVRAMARALGADDRDVVSPTYAMVQEVPLAPGVLVHLDLYRLEHPEDAFALGLEALPEGAIVAIEWPERGGSSLGAPDWRVQIRPVGEARQIVIEPVSG
ncbi:MAG: tRNA (adenosine(37)-N6)-threonylcarbamoyltransferase complex ATPase subunit type 1 TsaE [Candidatus Dadabacteria bacterium]|nr:MAG: tRNA (adenosine(37)-N6)-threonylcarbamoyltransferase complex ATPase subunit type 1 TsaE [Candidatus Dadabacteria bacterium]